MGCRRIERGNWGSKISRVLRPLPRTLLCPYEPVLNTPIRTGKSAADGALANGLASAVSTNTLAQRRGRSIFLCGFVLTNKVGVMSTLASAQKCCNPRCCPRPGVARSRLERNAPPCSGAPTGKSGGPDTKRKIACPGRELEIGPDRCRQTGRDLLL